MFARLLLPPALLALLTAIASAFAPVPVYKEPPKPAAGSIVAAMQGTWAEPLLVEAKGKYAGRVRIEGKTWTTVFATPKGPNREMPYELLLDTSRDPVALDVRRNPSTRTYLKGIVKME